MPYAVRCSAGVSEVIFAARVEARDGERPALVPESPSEWLAMLGRYAGKRVTVEVKPERKHRSATANAYLWGVVYPDVLAGLRELAFAAGEECPLKDAESLHSAMKYLLLGKVVRTLPGGVTVEDEAETKHMSSEAFGEFVSQVKSLAASRWGIYVREPGERIVA